MARGYESVVTKYPIDIALLRQFLEVERISQSEAASRLGIPAHAVQAHCKMSNIHGFPLRRGRVNRQLPVDEILEDIRSGMSIMTIATKHLVNPGRVAKLRDEHGIAPMPPGPRRGDKHYGWKGGRMTDADGYVLLYIEGHPMARKSNGHYVPEHRFVMSEAIGRLLEDNEVVHHKNGDKADNRIENLELFSSNGEHLKHELTGRVPQWSEDGLARLDFARRNRKREPIRLCQVADDPSLQKD